MPNKLLYVLNFVLIVQFINGTLVSIFNENGYKLNKISLRFNRVDKLLLALSYSLNSYANLNCQQTIQLQSPLQNNISRIWTPYFVSSDISDINVDYNVVQNVNSYVILQSIIDSNSQVFNQEFNVQLVNNKLYALDYSNYSISIYKTLIGLDELAPSSILNIVINENCDNNNLYKKV